LSAAEKSCRDSGHAAMLLNDPQRNIILHRSKTKISRQPGTESSRSFANSGRDHSHFSIPSPSIALSRE
jgi:hypothetical protein